MTFTRGVNSNANPNRIDGAASSVTGLVGASLSGVTQTHRSGGINIVESVAVQSDPNTMFGVLGRQTEANTFGFYSDARLAFYSIGESLDLALLDTRVTALVQRIQLFLSTGLDASCYDDATVAYLLAAHKKGATLV